MKKYILSIVALFATALVIAQQKKGMVVIEGTLNGDLKGYNEIYMYTRTSHDSTEIKNGHYTFSFPFSEAALKMFYPEYIKEMHQVYQPFGILISGPGTYYVTSDIAKGMYQSSEVKGPEDAVLYRQFDLDQTAAYKKINLALANLYGKNWFTIDEKNPIYQNYRNSSDSLRDQYLLPLIKNVVSNHPDSYASAYILAGTGREIGSLEKKEQLLNMLSTGMQKSEMGKKFADYIKGLKSSNIGNTVANFVLPDPQGKDIDFKDLSGKYVIVDFWASWCVPCRKSFPRMREVYQTFKNNRFEIYSISIDQDKAAWLKAVKDENNPWLQSLDTKNISQKGFAVTAVPATFLIDPQGKIIAKEVGSDPNGGGEIEKKLEELFDKKVESKSVDGPADKSKKERMKAIPMSSAGGS